MTYPFLILIDRANLEGWVFIFLSLAIYLYRKERYAGSSLLLGMAISMKAFPAVFLLLYLADKRYKEFLFSVASAIILTAASLVLFKGGYFENLAFVASGFNLEESNSYTRQMLDYSNNYIQRGVSLYTFLKVLFNTSHLFDFLKFKSILNVYIKAILALSFLLAVYIVFVEKIFWKRVGIITLMMLLFPHLSADYKLVHLCIPLSLYIIATEHSRLDSIYCWLFGLAMIPKNYIIIKSMISDVGRDVSIGVPINVLLLLILLSCLLYEGLAAASLESIKDHLKDHYEAFRTPIIRGRRFRIFQ